MIRNSRKKVGLFGIAAMSLLLAACGASSEGTTLTAVSQQPDSESEDVNMVSAMAEEDYAGGEENYEREEIYEAEEIYPIGETYADAADLDIVLLNLTEQEIKSIYVKVGEDPYSEDLLDQDDVFLEDEKRELFYGSSSDSDTIYIKIRLYDDSEYVIHYLPEESVEEAGILIEDGVAYLEYRETIDGEMITTKELEVDMNK